MINLRIVSVTVINSSNINAKFTASLDENIGAGNISIISQTPNVQDVQVLKVDVSDDTLDIYTQPLVPSAAYFIIFQSTIDAPFKSLNGDAVLFQDGVTNQKLITGPITVDNSVKQNLVNYLRDSIYTTESGTNIGNYVDALSILLSKAFNDIKQVGNENYLSFTTTNELQVRGSGPYDRLNQEGAYEVLKVSKYLDGAQMPFDFPYDEFPSDPVSLQQQNFNDVLTASSIDSDLLFNLNTFTLNLSNPSVIKLNSVIFNYSNGHQPYIYDIDGYGYQILNSKFDTQFASTYLLLNSSQIRLNDKILGDDNFSLTDISKISVNYDYMDKGRIPLVDSVAVSSVLHSGREVLPPLENIFTLDNAPIVDKNGKPIKLGGVSFTNLNVLPQYANSHPAFLYEVPFRLDYLPSRPGEFSVDYATGNVYVFGADNKNDGTGSTPPLAAYFYEHIFKDQIDYVYDENLVELVALPNGSLIDFPAKLSFTAELTLASGIDFIANIHEESLNERINNNLVALNALTTVNSPITNVFRIFNETSGEIYIPIRWNNNKVYFSYNKAPNLKQVMGERVSFENILNELLFINSTLPTANPSVNIFKILLLNNNIIASTEDALGSSFNTSVIFSNIDVFAQEIYFDPQQSEANNLLRINTSGYYQIDYKNGIVYCAVSSMQDISIGSVSYKRGYVITKNKHITSVEDIYYRFSSTLPKEKHFAYVKFSDNSILPSSFDATNEYSFNNEATLPYLLLNGNIGSIVNAEFIPGISQNIKFVRGIYEKTDLLNNKNPINFAEPSTLNGKVITVNPLIYNEYHTVQFDGYNYYILLNNPLFYKSPHISLDISAVRQSDAAQLWDNSGSLALGAPLKLILSGANSPQANDFVLVTYVFTINDFSSIVIDYNKGDYYIDYTYLADEILISYEYGDNVLDFSKSSALSTGDQYYVTYKSGALRDALQRNFGTLIDIPILANLSVDFSRERYRDALIAAMQSLNNGPTLTAIKNISQTISHTPPEIIESSFTNWSLGNSLLNQEKFITTGNFSLVPAKYGDGVLINNQDQTIKLPISSNLRLEEGSIECWVKPNWDGLDNQPDLSITVSKNGSSLPANQIYVGPSEYHPSYVTDPKTNLQTIIINKDGNAIGEPGKNKNGVFIYYNKDNSSSSGRWFIEVIDGYDNGYSSKSYNIVVNTNGKFYNSAPLTDPKPSSQYIFTGTNTLTYLIKNDADIDQGISFVSDNQHYLFDYGNKINSDRISLFKDGNGYFNFRVLDHNGTASIVSYNVSNWSANELHYVAAAWKINTKAARDEIHLFIDGLEVPNIIKYGDKSKPLLHQEFRTVNVEEVAGIINKNVVASNDLITYIGSYVVNTSLNLVSYGIHNGDLLYIEDPGFQSDPYTILNINATSITLDKPMPLTASNLNYSVNKTSFNVETEIDIFPNIKVSLLHSMLSSNDMQTISGSSIVNSAATNFINEGVLPGYVIRIIGSQYNDTYNILDVTAHTLTLDNDMPVSLVNLTFYIYPNSPVEVPGVRALIPAYEVYQNDDSGYTLAIRDKAIANDVVLIETLGLNHKGIKQNYYIWGNSSSVIKTKLHPPISLNNASIIKILRKPTAIGPALGDGYSILISGIFQSGHIITDQPSNLIGNLSEGFGSGRVLGVNISGTNIDFTYPVSVFIDGYTIDQVTGNLKHTNDTLSFNNAGTIYTDDLYGYDGYFVSINYVQVNCKPIDPNKNCLVVSVKEKNPITTVEANPGYTTYNGAIDAPKIRFSYQVYQGSTLDGYGDGYTVSDPNAFFSDNLVNSYLHIISPSNVAGYYNINDVGQDHKTLTLSQLSSKFILPLPYFTDAIYEILNVSTYRSGLQNGFFTFESSIDGYAGVPYILPEGLYEFDYFTYLSVPFEISSPYFYVGSDVNGNNQFDGVLNQFKLSSVKLTDVRVGETSYTTQESITKNFNSLKALKKGPSDLVLASFNSIPFINNTDFYISSDKNFIQSGFTINDNFDRSIVITNNPLIIDNDGFLSTKTEGTIEFWVSPIYDTHNDPQFRYYFDATSIISEKIDSISDSEVKIIGRASKILSVKLQVGDTAVDYFGGGSIGPDNQTIFLNRRLPSQETPVVITYVPTGTNGDRISIFKDNLGLINFNIMANSVNYQLQTPIFWTRGTWHRVKASYKMNGGLGSDDMRFFVDGYEIGNFTWGSNFTFINNLFLGTSYFGPNKIAADLKFKDAINQFSIGSDYLGNNTAYSLFDNFRLSDISRPLYQPFGESIDPNFSTNTDIVLPVVKDLYTTYLLDFDSLISKNTDFSTIRNSMVGLFDFTVNVFDSFGIVKSDSAVEEILKILINTLKPANSKSFINILSQ